jgi:FAD:protein FMN transferase
LAIGVLVIIMCGCRAEPPPTVAAIAAGGEARLQRLEFIAPHMGTAARIVLYAADPAQAQRAADAAFAEIARLDRMLSDYRTDSETSQVNAAAGKPEAVRVSREFIEVLHRAMLVSRLSDGAFDVSIGPVSQLWRAAKQQQRTPNDAEIHAAHALVNWREIEIDAAAQTVRLPRSGMRLDFGGIGKGYAVERGRRVLREHGVRSAVVSLSGDIAISAAPPGKRGWSVAIDDGLSHVVPTLELADCCVSTSGDAEQFLLLEGERRSHIIEPRSGLGLSHRIAATVIAPSGAEADAFATAVSVLGRERGMALIKGIQHASVRIVAHDEAGQARIGQSDGFAH